MNSRSMVCLNASKFFPAMNSSKNYFSQLNGY
jgi:hypothetical protein